MDLTRVPSLQPGREHVSTERCTVQYLERGVVEELLVDDGEAAEVMAAQERTFRARAGRVVQPSWPADAEWTLAGVTPYRRATACALQAHRSQHHSAERAGQPGWPARRSDSP